ncbi:MAG: ComEC/Rec2 family competence protein [Acidobacteria bacterium]|nr:ComEC/Rec2 family competence protein [Acidobacteriota bacterium]MBI3282241.1 ComEC/Rec2 family competence protein [Acidobacteriota bacterium]
MRDPLLIPCLAIAAGILAARFVTFTRAELAWGLSALLVLAVAAVIYRARRAASIAFVAAALFLGALTAEFHRPGPPPRLNVGAGETAIFEGCVVEPSGVADDREQFVLELAPGARVRITIVLRDGERPLRLAYGARAEAEARMRLPRNFHNPGSFDYAGYLARRSVYWLGAARRDAVRILPGACGSRFWTAIYRLRGAALDRLARLFAHDDYAAAMSQAILFGESARIEKVWIEDYRRTGTYHAIVISGLHLTFIAGAILLLARLLMLPYNWALTATALAAWLYVFLAGCQPPVLRAAGGFTLFLIARLFYRRGRLLNLLAATAVAFLLADPGQLFEASFQLSFLAVAAIGTLAVPLLERTSAPYGWALRGVTDVGRDVHLEPSLSRFRVELRLLAQTVALWTRLPERWIAGAGALLLRAMLFAGELAVVSLAVQIGLVLPMVVYFHRLSVSGLSANLLIVPLLTAVVPIGLLAVLTGWTAPAALASWLLGASKAVAAWHAAREPNWRIPDPPLWLAIAFASALVVLGCFASRTRARRPALASVLLLLTAIYLYRASPASPPALELTAIDVGQGDSLLARFPDGRFMLVDAGGIPVFSRRRRPRLDIGEDVVSPYLWARGIRALDVVAISHAHDDHIAGMTAIVENFHPRELWIGGGPLAPSLRPVLDAAARRSVRVRSLHSAAPFPFGGASVQVLWPPAGAGADLRNEYSLVLRLSFGQHAFLLAGDLDRRAEWQLLEKHLLQPADVLKVAHHGSRGSTTVEFLDAVRPVIALISAGDANLYRHPHPDTVARLRGARAGVFRTDLLGLTSVSTDGHRLRVETNHWAAGAWPRDGPFGDPF